MSPPPPLTDHQVLVACHQPDLLPYTGFWHKMVRSDVFVLLPYDQFQKHGYQRRVAMRGSWASHRLVGRPSLVPIADVQVSEDWAQHLTALIKGRYQGSAHWRTRGPDLLDTITDLGDLLDTSLATVNIALIHVMRDLLGITTPLAMADPRNTATGSERVLGHVLHARGTRYLSGQGAAAYMPDAHVLFDRAGVALQWSTHQRSSGDSILTAYFDLAHPMEAVLR